MQQRHEAFTNANTQFAFAGFIETSGLMRCVSAGDQLDFSGYDTWSTFVGSPRPTIVINRLGTSSGQSVLIVNTPLFDAVGSLMGATSVSIPLSLLNTLVDRGILDVDVAITDGDGKIMSLSGTKLQSRLAGTGTFAPAKLDIAQEGDVIDLDRYTSVSVVPLDPYELYVVGSWSNSANPLSVSRLGNAAPLFPVAMWLASLFVAIFAIQGLVLKHLKTLRIGMRRVSLDNIDARYVRLEGAPLEISEIGESFNALLTRISADSKALAEAADEKELLLKEVHHRVKNNLQLIASILNMQLRQISSPDAKSVLRRVQKRVMSLAAVHKLLYTDTKINQVRTDLLLSEIINNAISLGSSGRSGPKTSVSLEVVELDPDRAVPLALLVTEAVTNAMKYVGSASGTPGRISVSLSDKGDNHVALVVSNTLDSTHAVTGENGTGLGSKLIRAFVTQLDGNSRIETEDDTYTICVEFPKQAHHPAVQKAA